MTIFYLFDNAYFYDIEVDSIGNIYAGVGIWIDGYRDSRIYKFSPNGTILTIWGVDSENPQNDFTGLGNSVEIAIDSNDIVYAMSQYSPSDEKGDTQILIRKLNDNGTISLYYDIADIDSSITNIREVEYYGDNLYIGSGEKIYTFNLSTKELELYHNLATSGFEAATGIEFSNDGAVYIATGSFIRKLVKHNQIIQSAHIMGNLNNKREPFYYPSADEVNSGSSVDALNLIAPYAFKVAKIGNELYFPARDSHRIMKITFPSNELPTMNLVNFPDEIKKNYQHILEFSMNDSDGFVSKIYCDFDDGNGEQKIFSDNYGTSQYNQKKYVKYNEDGSYKINCITYDNEGLSTTYTKNFNIGEVNNKVDINWYTEEPDGYFSWSEANDWCVSKGYRLPYMSELIDVWNANGGVVSPSGFQKDTFYWSKEECSTEANCHKGCAMDYDCSTDDGSGWSDNGNGHPKCVMSDGETSVDDNLTTPTEPKPTLKLESSLIEGLGEGWHLLGSSEALNDFSIFNSAKIVWFYDFDKGWQNFTPIQSSPPKVDIKNFQGFWVKK